MGDPRMRARFGNEQIDSKSEGEKWYLGVGRTDLQWQGFCFVLLTAAALPPKSNQSLILLFVHVAPTEAREA